MDVFYIYQRQHNLSKVPNQTVVICHRCDHGQRTVPMAVAKKPEWHQKNVPVKNIKHPVQDVLIMRHDNTDLEPDKNKK